MNFKSNQPQGAICKKAGQVGCKLIECFGAPSAVRWPLICALSDGNYCNFSAPSPAPWPTLLALGLGFFWYFPPFSLFFFSLVPFGAFAVAVFVIETSLVWLNGRAKSSGVWGWWWGKWECLVFILWPIFKVLYEPNRAIIFA